MQYHGRSATEILVEYRMTVLELEALRAQYARLLFLGEPRPAGSTLGSAGRTNDAASARLQAQDGVLDKIKKLEKETLDRLEDFERVLATVKSVKIRVLLRNYYALGLSEEDTAIKMGMSRQAVSRTRLKVLEILC